ADTTIRSIQPADPTVLTFRESHVSLVQGGGPIYFNPYVRTIFQARANLDEISNGVDTIISAVEVQQTGRLNNVGNGIRSRYYNKVKGFVYHAGTRSLDR